MIRSLIIVLAMLTSIYSVPEEPQQEVITPPIIEEEIIIPEEEIIIVDPLPPEPIKESLGVFKLTAYCGCAKCCGNNDGITASGTKVTAGRTIAAPSRFAFGTQLEIDGYIYTVEDRGGAIKGNRIDIYFNSHKEALAFGVKNKEVFLIK